MPHDLTRLRLLPALAVLAAVAACDGEGSPQPIGPGPDETIGVFVLNSTGQTIAAFEIGDEIEEAETDPIDMGASFDGAAMDATEAYAVSTVSSFGGSRVLFADLATGDVVTTEFPSPEGLDANPSRAAFDDAGIAWFAGRGSDAIYVAVPGDLEATRVATDVGTFVEAVLPMGAELAAIDAYIDDDGGSYTPLGPSRVIVLDESGAPVDTIPLPDSALNAISGVVVDGLLVVLLGGTLDALDFSPEGDGGLVVVDVAARTTGPFIPLDANGVAIEAGADGLVYVTSTNDFVQSDAVSFDPATGLFVDGPGAPIDTRATNGGDIDCWAMTALEDGRLLCVTFSNVQPGRLHLLEADGTGIDWIDSGFGSSDLLLR